MIMLKTGLAVALLIAAAAPPASAGEVVPDEDIRVLLTFGGHGFEREPFFRMFDNLPGVAVTPAEMPAAASRLKPGLEAEFDVIVMYDMVNSISEKERAAFVNLLESGIGLVSLHHNLGAHRDWPEFTDIIGGRYLFAPETLEGREYPPSTYAHGQDMDIEVVDRDHPVTAGISNFRIHDEAYGGFFVSRDARVLLTTDHPGCGREIAWTTSFGNSRVTYILLGHDSAAWNHPAYPRLLVNAIRWAARR